MRSLVLVLLLVAIAVVPASATDLYASWDGSGWISVVASNGNNYGSLEGYGEYISGYFSATDQGDYIDTNVMAMAEDGGYYFDGLQELAGYTSNNAIVYAWTYGEFAGLNLRFDQSMYVVQLERVDTSYPLIGASGDVYNYGFYVGLQDRNTRTTSAEYSIDVYGSGFSYVDTNQWHPTVEWTYGWGNPDTINAPTPPGYYTPTNTIYAEGSGTVSEYGFGANYVNWNGYEMPTGGWFSFVGNFNDGFVAHPDVTVS
ncbi:hypothetical protein DRO97_08590 [Archaeoglobales archaeon]|nr:MAG: hypothetical protein DRO97_08590 [Archaeoglobales archaeon]